MHGSALFLTGNSLVGDLRDIMMLKTRCYNDSSGMASFSFGERSLAVGCGEVSTSPENFVEVSLLSDTYDYLILWDSRGATTSDGDVSRSFSSKLVEVLKSRGFSYFLISRPLNLTTFATLFSIGSWHDVKFGRLITNVGFVDTTPKKSSVLADMRSQYDFFGFDYTEQFFGKSRLLNGDFELLSSLKLGRKSINKLVGFLMKMSADVTLMNTPPLVANESLGFKRPRSSAFFSQLIAANQLVNDVCEASGCDLLDLSGMGLSTFDGVHFTTTDHQVVFELVCERLFR